MDLEKYYIGTYYKGNITLEQARNVKILAKFRCKRGHVFISGVDRAEEDIENNMCHCCRLYMGDAEEMGTKFNDDTDTKSLFQLDYEIFDGLIDKMISPETDCYINHESYRSRRGMGFVINGKYKKISPYQMVKKMTEQNQNLLAEKYRTQDKIMQYFIVVKCEACGKYMVRYREHIDLKNMKCDFCKEFVHQPFSFGRWLETHVSERDILQEVYDEKEYKRICGLHKDDSLTPILVSTGTSARSVTPLEITRGIVNIKV